MPFVGRADKEYPRNKLYPGPKIGGLENRRVGIVEGDMDRGYVSVGNGTTRIHENKSVQEIIDELTANWS